MIHAALQHRCAVPLECLRITLALAIVLSVNSACTHEQSAVASEGTHYAPVTRTITVTTVPLLVDEEQAVLPFLKKDFAKGGVLQGKEVYGFSPSTVTVVQGDTIHFNLINPEDDEHWFYLPDCSGESGESFVLPDCAVRLTPETETHAIYIARHAGIYPFMCIIMKHVPMMNGQIVVLSPAAVTGHTPTAEGRGS
jgi:plastocyanin